MGPYFGINHHLNVTKENYRLMNTLDGKHFAKINSEAGDVDFDKMILDYTVPHNNWETGYYAWKIVADQSIGKTTAMDIMMDELVHTKIPQWFVKIYGVYPEHSAKADGLLPHKRTPYISGPDYDRIKALKTLCDNIGTDAGLATLKTEILAYYATILACFNTHTAAMKDVVTKSALIEPMRVALAKALFANEGALMIKFKDTPAVIDKYFDVKAMRQAYKKPTDQGGMDIPMEGGEIELLSLHFKGTEIWSATYTGDHQGCIFFSNRDDLTEIPATWKFILDADTPKEIDLSTLPANYRFVYVANLSPDDEGSINITQTK